MRRPPQKISKKIINFFGQSKLRSGLVRTFLLFISLLFPLTAVADISLAHGKEAMVASPHPVATQTGLQILENGGSAIDAAFVMQMAMGVLDPSCSGLGGGGFLLYYRKVDDKVFFYDGRECSPKSASSSTFLDQEGKPLEKHLACIGGKAVGVPGLLKMLDMAHRDQGKMPWKHLFQRAISLAEEASLTEQSGEKNLKLANVLRAIANEGISIFYEGWIGRKIVDKIASSKVNPGNLTCDDLRVYKPIRREPIVVNYRNYRVYGAPPPSTGGIGIAQVLGMLENRSLDGYDFNSIEFINLFCGASQLSFADLGTFVADPTFFNVPINALLDKTYLSKRGSVLKNEIALKKIEPGKAPRAKLPDLMPIDSVLSTTLQGGCHICVVDRDGNAVCLSTSIGSEFGSKLNVEGFYLNNSLADFNIHPELDGKKNANSVDGGKRPASALCPIFVFDRNKNKLVLALGSAGGLYTIDYVAQALFGVLDFKLDVQKAISLPHCVAINEDVELERGTEMISFMRPLKGMGYKVVRAKKLHSCTQGIQILDDCLLGGADPRRGSSALGR
jgi:gamma-glutamyltranspeptidase/glutathione hydrolase